VEPERGVIELAVGPLGDGVALGASRSRRGEARLDVIRHIAANEGVVFHAAWWQPIQSAEFNVYCC